MKYALLTTSAWLLLGAQPGYAFTSITSPRAFTKSVQLKSTKDDAVQKKSMSFEDSTKEELDQARLDGSPSPLPEPLKGFHLPPWDDTQGDGVTNQFTIDAVNEYGAMAPKNFAALDGKSKQTTSFSTPQNALSKAANYASTVPSPKDYKFFGDGDYEKQLTLLLKTNPFMAAALTSSRDGGFELTSFDPSITRRPSLFLKIMRTLNGKGHRVNFKFDSTMNIESFSVFDDDTGEEITGDLDRKKYASSAMYNIVFFASCIHANIHIFHFLMTSALMDASKPFPEMHDLAVAYGSNIRRKYDQVGTLLITDPVPPADTSVLTGVNGFGSSQALRPILEDMLNGWGKTTTAQAFFNNLMNVPEYKMDKAGILVEFRKHLDLVRPFSKDVRTAFSTINHSDLRATERKLTRYLKACGSFQTRTSNLSEWMELMSVTGIVHGATLSYTRMMGDPGILRWRDIESEKWNQIDILLTTSVLGTIAGMEEGRHVMGNEVDDKKYESKLQGVLDEYDGKATELKEAYKAKLLAGDKDEFNNFGFILTDYGPDNFDGKQLTIATYI